MGRDVGEVLLGILPVAAAAAVPILGAVAGPAVLSGVEAGSAIAGTTATGVGEFAGPAAEAVGAGAGGLSDLSGLAITEPPPVVPEVTIPAGAAEPIVPFPDEPFVNDFPPLPTIPKPELTLGSPSPPTPPIPEPSQTSILDRIGTSVAGIPGKLLNAATSPGALVGAGLLGANMLGNVLNPPMPPMMIGMGMGQDPFSPVQPTINAGGPPSAVPPAVPRVNPFAPSQPTLGQGPTPTLAEALNINPQTGSPLVSSHPAPGMLPGGVTAASQQQLPSLMPPTYASPLTSGNISFNPSTGLMLPTSSEDIIRHSLQTSQGHMNIGI